MKGWFRRVFSNTGEWGEYMAEKHLKQAGMKILARRVRFGPREELDLVVRDKDILVFVEVKARKSQRYGRPILAVGPAKRRLLSRAAVRYLKRLPDPRVNFRFDVVEVIGSMEQAAPESIRHTRDVFPLDSFYTL